MKEAVHPIVTGIHRVKSPEDRVVIEAGKDGVTRARLMSGTEIIVADGNVEFRNELYRVLVTGGVNYVDLEIVDEKTKTVRQPLSPRSKLEFLSRIIEDSTAFEKVIVEVE